jgi:hypothetical protein
MQTFALYSRFKSTKKCETFVENCYQTGFGTTLVYNFRLGITVSNIALKLCQVIEFRMKFVLVLQENKNIMNLFTYFAKMPAERHKNYKYLCTAPRSQF